MRERNGSALRDRANIIRSVERLLAYCATIRGCRSYLCRGGTLALVLIVLDDDRGYDAQAVGLIRSRGGQAHIPTQGDRRIQRSVDPITQAQSDRALLLQT